MGSAGRKRIKFGKNEIIFTIAASGFAGMTIAAIFFRQEPSAILLGAILSALGLPIFLESDRKTT